MAIQYIKQLAKTTCGPVVIINAFKWLGHPVSANSYMELLKEETSTKKGFYRFRGTTGRGVQRGIDLVQEVLKVQGSHFDFRKRFNIRAVRLNLEKDNALIISWMRHWWFLPRLSASGNSVYVVNGLEGTSTLARISWSRFYDWWTHNYLIYPKHRIRYGWIVSKKPFAEWDSLKVTPIVTRYKWGI